MRELLADILSESLREHVFYTHDDNDGRVGYVDGDVSTLDLADDIIERLIPSVAHKGPDDTDAKFFRQVADRMEDPTKAINYVGGSNVRRAVRELLYRVAGEATNG